MTDLSRLIEDLCEGLESPKATAVSTSVETLSNALSDQVIENNFLSILSSVSTPKTDITEKAVRETSGTTCSDHDGSRASSSYAEDVENAERVERGGKTLAGSTSPPFPLSLDEVERVERENGPCGRPFLDLNRAAPQRSDWWTGPLMVEVDRAAILPSGTTLPISPEQVRAGVERELRALADLGVTGPEAQARAVAITRAKIRNSEALVEHQAHDGRCHVCGEPLDDTLPVVSVLTSKPGAHLHLHSGCHAEHVRRRAALVDKIMKAAGYGAYQNSGEAA